MAALMRLALDLNVSAKTGNSSGVSRRSAGVVGETVDADATAVAVDGAGAGAAARSAARDNERGNKVIMYEVYDFMPGGARKPGMADGV